MRMLFTHGARSVLRASKVAQDAGREVCGVRLAMMLDLRIVLLP